MDADVEREVIKDEKFGASCTHYSLLNPFIHYSETAQYLRILSKVECMKAWLIKCPLVAHQLMSTSYRYKWIMNLSEKKHVMKGYWYVEQFSQKIQNRR